MLFIAFVFSILTSAAPEKVVADNLSTGIASPRAINKELILKLINDARAKGVQCEKVWHPPVPPLTWNIQLEAAATLHSADMYKNKYFSHIDGKGNTANVRIEKAGYIWMTYGENIAFGYATESDVVANWLRSPGHCKNIMNKDFKEVGVGRVGDYWTQNFGAP